MIATKLMAEDSANNFSQNSGSEENSPPESASSTPTGAEAQFVEGPFHRVDVLEAPQLVEEQPEPYQAEPHQPEPHQPEPHQSEPHQFEPRQHEPQQLTLPVPQPPRVGIQLWTQLWMQLWKLPERVPLHQLLAGAVLAHPQ